MSIGSLVKGRMRWLLQDSPLADALFWAFAKLCRATAFTGKGSDVCLREGFLPVPVNFHSPIPDIT